MTREYDEDYTVYISLIPPKESCRHLLYSKLPMILLIKKAPGPLKAKGLFRGFKLSIRKTRFSISIKKVGMALRHSRNRKGIFILTNFQKKSIGENLILGFEKPYIFVRKTL